MRHYDDHLAGKYDTTLGREESSSSSEEDEKEVSHRETEICKQHWSKRQEKRRTIGWDVIVFCFGLYYFLKVVYFNGFITN